MKTGASFTAQNPKEDYDNIHGVGILLSRQMKSSLFE
jgi:hypothetical protein